MTAPVPTESGSYLVIDGELILDHATQPPQPVTTDGINQAPIVDDQGGNDVWNVIQPDGGGSDFSAGSKAVAAGRQAS